MGLFDIFKKGKEGTQARETAGEKVKQGATALGERIGRGASRVVQQGKEAYKRKYAGGEYREERVKESKARTGEIVAQAKYAEAQLRLQKAKGKSGEGFQPNYDFITGGNQKKDYSMFGGNQQANYDFITGGKPQKKSKDRYGFLKL